MRAALLSCLVAASALLATAEASLASSLEEIAIPSAALGKPMKAEIYRPDGAAPAAGWPVLYLLHGLHGCDRDWTALGGVQATLDRMIAAGKVRPMLVVMPDAGDSWYVIRPRSAAPAITRPPFSTICRARSSRAIRSGAIAAAVRSPGFRWAASARCVSR